MSECLLGLDLPKPLFTSVYPSATSVMPKTSITATRHASKTLDRFLALDCVVEVNTSVIFCPSTPPRQNKVSLRSSSQILLTPVLSELRTQPKFCLFD